jgi:hypothetical protein
VHMQAARYFTTPLTCLSLIEVIQINKLVFHS